MSKKDVSLNPQNINAHTWYYEYDTFIEVIYEVFETDRYIKTVHIKIPWRKLRASLKRLDKRG